MARFDPAETCIWNMMMDVAYEQLLPPKSLCDSLHIFLWMLGVFAQDFLLSGHPGIDAVHISSQYACRLLIKYKIQW